MSGSHPYVRLARLTVERKLLGANLPFSGAEVDHDGKLWQLQRACFVSIKTLAGDLRGCIGTILPVHASLDMEIISNAVAASTRDPRFDPMTAPELDDVLFSVDVLTTPEPAGSAAELDPKVWGVIVSRGLNRGVLLPDLDGVDTVEYQLEIAASKAGLRSLDGVTVEKFRVDRYREDT